MPRIAPIFDFSQAMAMAAQTDLRIAKRQAVLQKPVQFPKISLEKTSISIDIKKEMSAAQQKHDGGDTQEKRATPFDAGRLKQAWNEYVESGNVQKEHVRQMLSDVDLELTDDAPVFEVTVPSNVQKDVLLEVHDELVGYLCNALENDFADFQVAVSERKTPMKKVLTDADRFRQMLDENEAFRRLASDLSLEIS